MILSQTRRKRNSNKWKYFRGYTNSELKKNKLICEILQKSRTNSYQNESNLDNFSLKTRIKENKIKISKKYGTHKTSNTYKYKPLNN